MKLLAPRYTKAFLCRRNVQFQYAIELCDYFVRTEDATKLLQRIFNDRPRKVLISLMDKQIV